MRCIIRISVAETVHMLKEEMVTHSSFQRSNKGSIQFADISADGRFIVLENIGTKVCKSLTVDYYMTII